MRPLLVVLASNYRDFQHWCHESGLSPQDPDVMFVDRWDRLRGMTHFKVIRCPRWHSHPDAGRIDEALRIIEQKRQAITVHVQPDPPRIAEDIRDIRRNGPSSRS